MLIGLLIPFLGTMLGSAMVFLMKKNFKVEKLLLAIASGVMIAASVWSLLIPAINMAEEDKIIAWLPATIGFFLGIIFLYLFNKGIKKLESTTMLAFAVTIHNIPEGMAVGVAIAGALSKNSSITMASAIALAIGIGIQNFPEGAIISMPLKEKGKNKLTAFILGTLSGIVEPIGGIITILLTGLVVPILPYLLAFAAGAMIYVVVEELIPEAKSDSNLAIIGFSVGFILMMILDVALG